MNQAISMLQGMSALAELSSSNTMQFKYAHWRYDVAEDINIQPISKLKELSKISKNVWADMVINQDCHTNASKIVFMLNSMDIDAKMVSGLASGIIPIDHSWVKVGSKYFDPTWEIHNAIGDEYTAIVEITTEELEEIWKHNSKDWEIMGPCIAYYKQFVYSGGSNE